MIMIFLSLKIVQFEKLIPIDMFLEVGGGGFNLYSNLVALASVTVTSKILPIKWYYNLKLKYFATVDVSIDSMLKLLT